MSIKIIVTLDCGHVLTYTDRIEEKYPFYCAECEEPILGKYPWVITTELV
jgi:hypothetical protein